MADGAGDAARTQRHRTAMAHSTLTILLDRAGGRVEFTEADYQRVVARYGGRSEMNLRLEVVRQAGRPDMLVARLERKPAKNLDLPS
ncbi:MAG: hypothetical protein M5T61_09330 [Acidimicrobiia bacterium]|nr:hypothetical protein [Acidimicrobiia bacterium]